ncbi:hypothetical protein [Tenacibaculum geojense]|uniref:PKD domain-containing protein n=1 Tax=Tenacibaculum geojense TaxID=915352 RepID=A0ABW3JNF1_9FLAO
MKRFNKIYYTLTAIILLLACTDDVRELSFLDSIEAPTNVAASYNITQDNSGVVTITPTAEGATEFEIYFGDDTPESVMVANGESVSHTYAEGSYEVKIIAFNIKGDTSEATQPLVVSFRAPENLVITVENDAAISKQVNVTATADFATMYEFYSGEDGVAQPVATANIGEQLSYNYTNPGVYDIKVIAKGAAIATTEVTQSFEVTEILQPIQSAPIPPARGDTDVISIYTDASYTNVAGTDTFPDWGQGSQGSSWTSFNLNGDNMLQYINLSYQGIQFGSPQDVSTMQFLHLDVWTTDVASLETSLISVSSGEQPVSSSLTAGEWTSIDIPISAFTDQGLSVTDIHQLKFVGDPWGAGSVFIDNIYFWKEPAPASGIEGTWVIASEPGALKVGPQPYDGSWWSNDAQTVIDRACYFDDQYVFATNGSFQNILGNNTWLEGWQGTSDQCGTPVAPHNGSNPATYIYDAGANTITLNGQGAYLGLPKANNQGELPNVPVPNSITYGVQLSNNNNTMELVIETGTGSGVFWTFKLVRYQSPVEGTWRMANEPGALKVGPQPNDGSWWSNDEQVLIDRACYFDDEYVFGSNGSFQNIMGTDTWLEGWQGVNSDQCGAPVAPHDGNGAATYIYDEGASTLTVNGSGSYLGLPKANNQGELPSVAVPNSITYNVLSLTANEMILVIETGTGSGVFWTFKLVK